MDWRHIIQRELELIFQGTKVTLGHQGVLTRRISGN